MKPEQDFLGELLGHYEHDVARALDSGSWDWRVVKRDGRGLMGVNDMRSDRINLVVGMGIVLEAYWG